MLSSPNAYHCHKITIATALPATHTMRRHLSFAMPNVFTHSLHSLILTHVALTTL